MQTPATAEIKKLLRVQFFKIFDSGSERKTQNPTGVDSGSMATFDRDHKEWHVSHEKYLCIIKMLDQS